MWGLCLAGKKRNEWCGATREVELTPTSAPTREHRPPSKSHWGKLSYVTIRGSSEKDHHQRSTSWLCSSYRGAQMLSPKCDSRYAAVSKIHQGTVCVPVTHPQSRIFTYQTLPRAGRPLCCRGVGKEWIQQYSTPVFSACALQTSFPWGGNWVWQTIFRAHKNN